MTGYGWHDQQRIAQIVFLIVCLGCGFFHVKSFPAPGLIIISVIFILGFVSSLLAKEVWWALMEWALYVGLFFLALISASLNRVAIWRLATASAAAVVGAFLAFQFLVYYISSFLSGVELLDPSFMYGGFSNPRFLGQFQVMLIPVLAGLTFKLWEHRYYLSILCGVVLLLHWVVAFMLGGRGVWISLLLSHAALIVFAPALWRIVLFQVILAAFGFSLFKVMFDLIPFWAGIEVAENVQLRFDLSARDIIWVSALEMAASHPWFGVGPMNFSAVVNPIAAHPHQFLLQWFTEWGGIVALFVVFLALRGMSAGVEFVRAERVQCIDLAIWLAVASAIILAQVDGVFVMPYAQTWLALLVGGAFGSVSKLSSIRVAHVLLLKGLAVPAFIVLSYVLLLQAPLLPEAQQAHFEKYADGHKPRFWSQGWIPMEFIDHGVAD